MYRFREYLPFYKRNMKVALPVMITQAGQVLIQLADNVMVGHVSTDDLAGVSFANALFMIGFLTLLGFSQGLTPLVGECIGRNDTRRTASLLKNSLTLNATVFTAAGLLMAAAGLAMPYMGQDPDIIPAAQRYYFLNILSLIPSILFVTSRQFAEGIGNTSHAMWLTMFTNLLNIFLNWVFIYGHLGSPQMGASGAALATLISRTLAGILFFLMICRFPLYRPYLDFSGKWTDIAVRQEIISVSTPVAFSSLLEVTAFNFASVMIGWMGKVEQAGHQIAYSLSQISYMIACGVGSAATIRVSHQYGSGKYRETYMAGKAAIHMSLVYMAACGIFFVIFNRILPLAFTSDPEVLPVASRLLIVIAIYQFSDAVQLSSMASLRGLQDTKRPMLYAGISYYLVAIPAGYLLGLTLRLGPEGVWMGLMLGLTTAAVLYYIRFRKLCRELVKD